MAVVKGGKIKQNFKNHIDLYNIAGLSKIVGCLCLVTTLIMLVHVLSFSRSLCTVTQRDGVIYLNPMSFSQ